MEIPYEVTPRRDTGLYNAKLGVWLFLASEVMLFGGLFSAYVFLRVGVKEGFDNPWPWGLNVHKHFVWLGFTNTLVLIFSSVGVVFAWVALKERNWRKFQVWMYTVVGCAVVFMALKTIEYNSKLNHHHGIKLVDNSVMEGHIVHGTDKIRFEADTIDLSLQGAVPGFIKDLDGDFPTLTAKVGDETTEISSASGFKSWFHENRRAVARELTDERARYRAELKKGSATPVSVNTAATLTAAEPFKLNANPRRVVAHSDTSVSYKDGTKIGGNLISDDVEFELHEVDMQLVLPQDQRTSVLWDVVDDEEAKKQFFAKQTKYYKELKEYYGKRNEPIPEKMLRGHVLNLHPVHLGGHGDHGEHADGEHAADEHHGENVEDPHVDDDESFRHEEMSEDHEGEQTITVPRDQIKFMGNHGPRYGNYYAIYFTMTALHGLHVIGGALVLLFFVVFGKKLYLKNPEHLANRVEVGGLFWHFVDLIWIFLFPIMYLL